MKFPQNKLMWSQVVSILALISLICLAWILFDQQSNGVTLPRYVQVHRSVNQMAAGVAPTAPIQVVVGTPAAYSSTPLPQRYTYRNEFPTDPSKPLPLYISDTQTNQETRLGDDTGAAVFSAQNENYLLWHFICIFPCKTWQGGLYVYTFATQTNRLVSISSTSIIHPKIADDWVAFGDLNRDRRGQATLFATNLQTHEIITLTQELGKGKSTVDGYFGISSRLVAWYIFTTPPKLFVYDLAIHKVVATLTDLSTVFADPLMTVYGISPGETSVNWTRTYGYDLVTGSYFRLPSLYPPNWDHRPIATMSAITEKERVLYWTFQMDDGTQRYIKAPLIDATPSAAPCVEGQNLVKNGDLEDIAAHNVWQQSDTPSDLIVNDLPPNAPQAGQWAIRLGRYSNSQLTIQQTLNIPSNVKHIQLAFDVRASSWDIWGGDQLQVDLIDSVTNQSILATPVQWTNRQLANGGWIPLQVDIQDWPGIDTPLQLVFRAQTDWAFPTAFTIDNIRFLTTCH